GKRARRRESCAADYLQLCRRVVTEYAGTQPSEPPMKPHSLFWSKWKQVAFEEVEVLLSRRVLAQIAQGFPTQSFSRTRTALLRRAGLQIGKSSLVQGPVRITGVGNP